MLVEHPAQLFIAVAEVEGAEDIRVVRYQHQS
jgi:hypothetical protein